MSTPYTPAQVVNNLKNFVRELRDYPTNLEGGPGFVHHQSLNIIARGIAETAPAPEPGSLLDTLANDTAALDTVLIHQGQHMTPDDLYQRRMLVAATKHTLETHGIKI
jgi:hypothetical protein